jgi:hypothetical protein
MVNSTTNSFCKEYGDRTDNVDIVSESRIKKNAHDWNSGFNLFVKYKIISYSPHKEKHNLKKDWQGKGLYLCLS